MSTFKPFRIEITIKINVCRWRDGCASKKNSYTNNNKKNAKAHNPIYYDDADDDIVDNATNPIESVAIN